jgi:hypothetical protein
MAQHQVISANALEKVDPVWARIRLEAEEIVRREPELSSFIYSTMAASKPRSSIASVNGSTTRTFRPS